MKLNIGLLAMKKLNNIYKFRTDDLQMKKSSKFLFLLVFNFIFILFLTAKFISAGTCSQIGTCNSDGTGICLSDGNGGVQSVTCSGGCVDNTCTSDVSVSTYDLLGRLTSISYSNTDVITYNYYDLTSHIKMTISGIGDAQQIKFYDYFGNLLSEVYAGHSEKDIYYQYVYPTNTSKEPRLVSIKKNNVMISYSYDGNDRVVKESTEDLSNGKTTQVIYAYEGDNLKNVTYPGKTKIYTYDSNGYIIKEEIKRIVDGQTVTDSADYNYDEGGDVINVKDNTGVSIDYAYNSINYSCSEIQCNVLGCTDPETCYTFNNCDSGTCVPYECSDYSLVPSTCSYKRLASQNMNGQVIDLKKTDAGLDSFCQGDQCYTPIQNYDSNGLINEDDYYTYAYDNNFQLITQTAKDGSETITYTYDSEGNIIRASYASNDYIDYRYDPLGNLIAKNYVAPYGSYTSGGVTGAFISNLFHNFLVFTGNVIGSITGNDVVTPEGTTSYTEYATNPGDSESFVDGATFDELVSSFEIENGPIEITDSWNGCFDSDGSFDFNQSTFKSSYVFYDMNYSFDSCSNNNTLREYYCGGLFTNSVKSNLVDCQFGCIGGACLIAPLNETRYCSAGTTGIYPDCRFITNQTLDLPPEPLNLEEA